MTSQEALMLTVSFGFGAITQYFHYRNNTDKINRTKSDMIHKALEGGLIGTASVGFLLANFEFRAPFIQSGIYSIAGSYLGWDMIKQIAIQSFNLKKKDKKEKIDEIQHQEFTSKEDFKESKEEIQNQIIELQDKLNKKK